MTMALTATAQSALPGLSWDEQIVPALRKRLESESRALSKRMSTVSIGSADESSAGYVKNSTTRPSTSRTDTANGRVTPASTSTSATTDRPSAIPRPSLNYSRPLIDRSNNYAARPMPANVSVEKPQPKRSRTYSQPYPYDPSLSTRENGSNSQSSSTKMTNALPTPASSRSNSPAIPMIKPLDVKPTRIPKVASNQKVALSSSTNGSAKSESRNTPPQTSDKRFLGPEYTTDNWQVYENSQYASSQSSVSVPRQTRQNGIMYEMPPFTANSYTSSIVTDAEPTARLSAEEERPFEHWYRGDLSRNGGVGELRIGNRMEMLEIANYGHKLRQLPNGSMAAGRRRRAESIGNRESVILDEYDPRGTMVLDETPLTDMEVDTELETDREMSFTSSMRRPREPERTNTNASNHSEDTTITATPTMLTIAAPRQRMDSQIPRATQIPKQPAYTYRSASEPPETLAASTSTNGSAQSRLPAAMSQSMSSAQQKRSRTKSPAAAPANKKPKGAIGQKRSKSAIDVRLRSGGTEYPDVPDEPGMADAIPSWTQPKRNGNWDEVVLPVVARKMGLDDQYEEASGSPQPARRPSEERIPPAPGTFGYDPSKRRQRYDGDDAIPMDEFGQVPPTSADKNSSDRDDNEKAGHRRPPPIDLRPSTGTRRHDSPPPSPAPFSQYTRYSPEVKPAAEHSPPPTISRRIVEEKDDAGCCKCIIM